MKKIILAFILAACFQQLEVKAQVGLAIGVKGGFNTSDLTNNMDGNFDARTSGAAGLYAALILAKVFVIQPEFLVRQGGATQNSSNYDTKLTLNYFQVPVLFKIRIPFLGKVFPHVFAGPTFDYMTDYTLTRTKTPGNNSNTNLSTAPIENTGFGGLVGAGLDLELGRLFLTFDGRYGLGFTDISNAPFDVRGTYYTFMGGIGYKFGSK